MTSFYNQGISCLAYVLYCLADIGTFPAPDNYKFNIVCTWALETNIFRHQATKNQYSCAALPDSLVFPGGPWHSLVLSGALWFSLAISRAPQRSLPFPASEINICCPRTMENQYFTRNLFFQLPDH